MNSKAVLISENIIKQTLSSVPVQGKRLLEPLRTLSLKEKIPLNILEDKDIVNEAEVHTHEADLWLCLEGEVTFTCGGEMLKPWFKKNTDGTEDQREIKAKKISGGTQFVLKAGDWLWIPAGVSHQHQTSSLARLVIIKIPKTS